MTHDDLINVSIRWLKKPYKNCAPYGHSACSVILTELVTQAGEIPDAIGFSGKKTIVIEAKTSISDFRADEKKSWRKADSMGMGALRYYICEENKIPIDVVPEKWGLIYVSGKKITVVKESLLFEERQWEKEIMMLLSHIRQISDTN